ncbi:hypothetical protein BCR15_13950 [Tessaracoccus lapidicaptus]|uniref:Uncharacterized protein n=1 Tax=Tessaracoccus lapidicaptus TaxID=1427523 RepID=A0A1C0AR76_9ACTN|nr:hypothetical protein BCR15_13950 [Tessaracoccus lapidicaptus]
MKITLSAPSVVVSAKGGATEPWLFTVGGKPCSSEYGRRTEEGHSSSSFTRVIDAPAISREVQ